MSDLESIHGWFGLTYSSYLVVQRSLLQSMPVEWQAKFVALLEEMRGALGHHDEADGYQVRAKRGGKFVRDDLADYERGRRRLPSRYRR